jgi:hypothetical protein
VTGPGLALGIALHSVFACSDRTAMQCRKDESLLAGDGCNECYCVDGSEWVVTEKGCAISPPLDGTPLCYDLGVRDVEPDEAGLQIDCAPKAIYSDGTPEHVVVRCSESAGSPEFPSGDVDLCWFALTDDAVSPECIASRGDEPAAEVAVLRREGTEATLESVAFGCEHPPQCPGWALDSDG